MSLASETADDESSTVDEPSNPDDSCMADPSGPRLVLDVGVVVTGDDEAADGLLLDAGGPGTGLGFGKSPFCSTPAASPPA